MSNLTWSSTKKLFTERHPSVFKQKEMPQPLNSFLLKDFLTTDMDKFSSFVKHHRRISRVVSKARPKDQRDMAKVRFLIFAVKLSNFRMRLIFRFPPELFFPRIFSAITTSLYVSSTSRWRAPDPLASASRKESTQRVIRNIFGTLVRHQAPRVELIHMKMSSQPVWRLTRTRHWPVSLNTRLNWV